ncbi:ubiquitin-like modifier-activating enzyme 6 [Limulus polyphemus]|uniref:Ubiquitin-like modifier-activating enzyme 6 n=1 Tax=Limulus polyphemus TaxID=6850 RepID=A0ABM1B706_LIMPO|nr:ubiquitin-like modifier-activating enzyme 6 [Limulus polyphemus]
MEGFDEAFYNRQLYAIGYDAMRSLSGTSVLLCGFGGLGIEIAKNLVLLGIKQLTINVKSFRAADTARIHSISFLDSGNANVSSKTFIWKRKLQELNSDVTITITEKSEENLLDCEWLSCFQCVILTETQLDTQIAINKLCRSKNYPIPCIVTDVFGFCASIFCDFGESFTVVDADGEELKEVQIGNIAVTDDLIIIFTVDSKHHGFDTGVKVILSDIVGMEALNGTVVSVNVLSPSAFSIVTNSGKSPRDYGNYVRGGLCRQVQKPKSVYFESIETQIWKPTFSTSNMTVPDIVENIHVGLLTTHFFYKKEGRLPRIRCEHDSKYFLEMAMDVNSKLEKPVEFLHKNFLQMLSFTARGQVTPLLAFLGGVVGQEVLKAVTKKFTPIQQWFHFEVQEVCSSSDDPDNFVLKNDNQDSLRICIGNRLCEMLAETKLFIVGCGAVGCEIIKNCALLGVASGGGKLTLTDHDLIEKSNLNRQFLFRNHHIRQPKSMIAAKAVQEIDPSINIECHQLKVCVETDLFNDEFFNQQDLIVNALDNLESRRYMDKRCVENCKPLLESGTMGSKGHVQVIIPNLTEHYSAQSDPSNEEYPLCTIKSFPSQLEHTVQWALDKFTRLLYQKPIMWNQFWIKNRHVQDILVKLESGDPVENIFCVAKFLKVRPYSFEDCVRISRIQFEKYFNHKALQLLGVFPLDSKLRNGTFFWQSPKRPPKPLNFSWEDEQHRLFVISMSKLLATIWGIPLTSADTNLDNIQQITSTVKVPDFYLDPQKHIEIDEKAKVPSITFKHQDEMNKMTLKALITNKMSHDMNEIFLVSPIHYNKDDYTEGHVDFVTAAANLRAQMYGIQQASRTRIKQIAGKIIPALATTTSAVGGLMALELIKIVKGLKEIEHYRNYFLNLAIASFVPSQPAPPQVQKLGTDILFTVWDRWEINGYPKMTLQDFLDALQKQTGLHPSMVVKEAKMIWVYMMPNHNKRKTKTMKHLIKPSDQQKYADLTVAFQLATGDEALGPIVRYYFNLRSKK